MHYFYIREKIKKLVIIQLLTKVVMFSIILFAFEQNKEESVNLKLAPTEELYKIWYESAITPLRDNEGKFRHLDIKAHDYGYSDVALSTQQRLALDGAINWNFEIFFAEDFDEYYRLLKKISEDDLKISPMGYQKMRADLKSYDATRQPELLTDYELVQAYWLLTSKVGHLSKHFIGLVTNESFYHLKEIRDRTELNTAPNPFPKDLKMCGSLSQSSSYIWGASDPNSEFDKNGELLIADIRYLVKTNVRNLAYPICIRLYWNQDLGKWIPWFCIEYNISELYYHIVF